MGSVFNPFNRIKSVLINFGRTFSQTGNMDPVRIGTHDGVFHCDEVLACFMLRLLPQYKEAEIIRTRDLDLLNKCDIVVDVGGVYDAEKFRFDHHQRSFTESMSTVRPGTPWTTRLSSAGLVYAHFGEDILSSVTSLDKKDPFMKTLFSKIYEDFVEEIDANDNGIHQNDAPTRFKITSTLSHRVSYLRGSWRDKNWDSNVGFYKALDMVGSEFMSRVKFFADDWAHAYAVVQNAIECHLKDSKHEGILIFDDGGAPWKDHLFHLETERNLDGHFRFVIFPDEKGNWRVQGVPMSSESFILRTPLLEAWRGLRDKELEELSGIPGTIFVHASGFIGGAQTQEGALEMARKTLAKSQFPE